MVENFNHRLFQTIIIYFYYVSENKLLSLKNLSIADLTICKESLKRVIFDSKHLTFSKPKDVTI